VTSAEPEPELTEPELSELLLPDVVPVLVLVPVFEDDDEAVAWERAAAPTAIVAATAATARPEVTTVVVRRADSRELIGSSWVDRPIIQPSTEDSRRKAWVFPDSPHC
jgi:hypothetical protein